MFDNLENHSLSTSKSENQYESDDSLLQLVVCLHSVIVSTYALLTGCALV